MASTSCVVANVAGLFGKPSASAARPKMVISAGLVRWRSSVWRMCSGLFMAAEPVGAGRTTICRQAGMADKARPVGQSIRARHSACAQIFPQGSPRLLLGRVFPGNFGDVQQHRFAPFLNGKTAEARDIDAR